MVNKLVLRWVIFTENLINLLAVVIVLVTLYQALEIYINQYQEGIIAKVNSSIHMMEGLSMALSYMIATGVLKLIRINSYSQIAFIGVLTLLKKLVTYFLNQDIEYAHSKSDILGEFD